MVRCPPYRSSLLCILLKSYTVIGMNATSATPDFLSLRTVSERTGRPVELLRRWVTADPPVVPGRQIDGSWYIRSTDLDLVERQARKPWKTRP
jgi:hypothetical protein